MEKLKTFILSRNFLVVFTLIYIIMIHNIASGWAKLSGQFEVKQLFVAYVFYGAVYLVILSVRHHYKINHK